MERQVRNVTDRPDAILDGLKATPYTPRVDFEELGIKLNDENGGNGTEGENGHGGTPEKSVHGTEPNVHKEASLAARAKVLALETLPACFVVSSKFKRQYVTFYGTRLQRINIGLLKIAEWHESGGTIWKNALKVSELKLNTHGLFRVRISMGSAALRVLFSYIGENGNRKIVLEEVGPHDDVTGGNR
jgi:hypothetical protein